MTHRRMFIGILMLLTAALPAAAQQRWTADSTTAMAVTGDVRFSPTRITFGNGAFLPLQFLRAVPGLTWMPGATKTTPASLYRITAPQNPGLLRGNLLCGAQPPTFITVARKGDAIFLSVYDGPTEPTLPANAYCAGYSYGMAQ